MMYNKYKDQKLKAYIQKYPTIVALDNKHLDSLIKNSKINFINKNNSCPIDSACQLIYSFFSPKK